MFPLHFINGAKRPAPLRHDNVGDGYVTHSVTHAADPTGAQSPKLPPNGMKGTTVCMLNVPSEFIRESVSRFRFPLSRLKKLRKWPRPMTWPASSALSVYPNTGLPRQRAWRRLGKRTYTAEEKTKSARSRDPRARHGSIVGGSENQKGAGSPKLSLGTQIYAICIAHSAQASASPAPLEFPTSASRFGSPAP